MSRKLFLPSIFSEIVFENLYYVFLKCLYVLVAQSCLTFCDSKDCSLEWVAISFSRGSFWPRDRIHVSHIAGQILYPLIQWRKPLAPIVDTNRYITFLFIWRNFSSLKRAKEGQKEKGEPKMIYCCHCYSFQWWLHGYYDFAKKFLQQYTCNLCFVFLYDFVCQYMFR